MRDYLHNLAQYDAWANRELLASLCGPAADDARVAMLLGQLLAGKRVWLARVEGLDTYDWNLFPVYPTAEANRLLQEADDKLLDVTRCDDAALDRVVDYRNQTGTYFKTSLADIVIHLVNHGTYHQGQIATAVKAAGAAPAITDYIAWVRAGRP